MDRVRLSRYDAAYVGCELGMGAPVSSTTTPQPLAYSGAALPLAFEDHFDGNALDDTRWTVNHSTDGGTERKKDDGWATASAVTVANSMLTIRARKLPLATDNHANMTMAFVTTRGKRSTFTHGWLETRMRTPTGKSCWPAFWALGNGTGSLGWPQCGEWDWLEWFNTKSISGVYTANMHWGRNKDTVYGAEGTLKYEHKRYNPAYPNSAPGGTWPVVPFWGDGKFHVWNVHRTSTFMRTYVDGVMIYEWLLGETPSGKYKANQTPEFEPLPAMMFDDPIHHRFDLQVGGHARWSTTADDPQGEPYYRKDTAGNWVIAGYAIFEEGDFDIDYLREWSI